MHQTNRKLRDYEWVAQIVADAGGRIVGRTKLQKIVYLLEVTGLGYGFYFKYRHYGPYCEDLASAAQVAHLFGELDEVEHPTNWGGYYSEYTVQTPTSGTTPRSQLAQVAAKAGSIELELAATAAYLAKEGRDDPWGAVADLKPEKATPERLRRAKELYRDLCSLETPEPLPGIG